MGHGCVFDVEGVGKIGVNMGNGLGIVMPNFDFLFMMRF